jgi:hypothetical protein
MLSAATCSLLDDAWSSGEVKRRLWERKGILISNHDASLIAPHRSEKARKVFVRQKEMVEKKSDKDDDSHSRYHFHQSG